MLKYHFDAVIFDLDGVITKTATVHSHAWKKMFDKYLLFRAEKYKEVFCEFTQNEYLIYVDGKPRYDGVKSFLTSRNIILPFGASGDTPDMETVCGLGNKKNFAFNEVLKNEGVEVYPSSVKLMKSLQDAGIGVGVASSSKNCRAVLEVARLENMVATRVDGIVSAKIGLKGKPAPDIFLTAAKNLNVKPAKTVVVEDATSGVAAGKNGNFGLVIGIARDDNRHDLKINGADWVVNDLEEVNIEKIDDWFVNGMEKDSWQIAYYDYDTENERSRETLLTVGNGYFGTRGVMEESEANAVNYPGTYIAGVYNRLTTVVTGKEVVNEDFVNCPNFLPIRFKVDDGLWINPNNVEIVDIERKLNLRNGLLSKKMVVKDDDGHLSRIQSERFASMHNPHIAGLRYKITPLNYAGTITICSILDGTITNQGVERYRMLNSKHLEAVEQGGKGRVSFIKVKTNQSDITIAEAARLSLVSEKELDDRIVVSTEEGIVFSVYEKQVIENQSIVIEKVVSIFTSLEEDNPLMTALEVVKQSVSFDKLFVESALSWGKIWDKIDIVLQGDRNSQKLLRLHLYHLLVSASPHNENIDASVTARGLHGEAYRGHVFWDELFILPFYAVHFPKTARSLLMYRYRRLDKAREYASQCGYKGAMFPWQSGSSGSEETQTLHLNPVSSEWGADYSSLQRHISLAVAYNIWEYFSITNDIDFLECYGLEMYLEICRFWKSKTFWDKKEKRYSIDKVMGPDEFHEMYPESNEGGLRDNAYTNIMVAWLFKKAKELLETVGPKAKKILAGRIGFDTKEIDIWQEIRKKLRLVISPEGIIAQYDGYFDLKELDWNYYRKKYGNVCRMDRLLKAEGKSADEYKVAKQADTLMVFYNLKKEEVDCLLEEMGYHLPIDYLEKNLKYYLQRTSHGSTLSRVVHARLAQLIGEKQLGYKLFSDALNSDFNDIQGGTTGEGIHAGVMAGTVMITLTVYSGINLKSKMLHINPDFPKNWEKIKTTILFRNNQFDLTLTGKSVSIKSDINAKVTVFGKETQTNKLPKIMYKINS